jgi:hypothetical protein
LTLTEFFAAAAAEENRQAQRSNVNTGFFIIIPLLDPAAGQCDAGSIFPQRKTGFQIIRYRNNQFPAIIQQVRAGLNEKKKNSAAGALRN